MGVMIKVVEIYDQYWTAISPLHLTNHPEILTFKSFTTLGLPSSPTCPHSDAGISKNAQSDQNWSFLRILHLNDLPQFPLPRQVSLGRGWRPRCSGNVKCHTMCNKPARSRLNGRESHLTFLVSSSGWHVWNFARPCLVCWRGTLDAHPLRDSKYKAEDRGCYIVCWIVKKHLLHTVKSKQYTVLDNLPRRDFHQQM